MNVTPLPVAPAPATGGRNGTATAGSDGAATGFAALLAGALGGLTAATAANQPGSLAVLGNDLVGAWAEPGSDQTQSGEEIAPESAETLIAATNSTDPAAPGLEAPAIAALAVVAAPQAGVTPSAAGSPDDSAQALAGPQAASAAIGANAGATLADTTSDADTSAGRNGLAAQAALGTQAAQMSQAGSDPAPAISATTGATGAQAATAASLTGASNETNAVARQVFPEVARLATAGNGTHRLTLTLNPEELGAVRVTLTMRDGMVRVTLAGSEVAGQALLAGSSELHRLLGAAGAVDTQVWVRDQNSGDLWGQSRQQADQRQGFDQTGADAHGQTPGERSETGTGHESDRSRLAGAATGTAALPGTNHLPQDATRGVDVTV